ncbi:hypothetical protein [Segatella salivae]|nr:hypothetical protein [Segatella salivae]
MQRHRYRGKFPMNAPAIANVITMQCHRFYVNISMNTSAIANVITMQCHRYRGKFPMDAPAIANVATTQRCKRCTYDSPGLASESEGYPGSFAVRGNNAVGVVPFILWCFIAAFHAENVQHLRR